MKSEERFFTSLEKYVRIVVGRSPLPKYWAWMVSGVALVVMGTSLAAQNGIVGARSTEEAVRIAAGRGDYTTAEAMWNNQAPNSNNQKVLGTNTQLEDMVYPERKVERRIAELTLMLEKYPDNKDVYTNLAQLYFEIGNEGQATEYAEKARVLDPNGQNPL